MIGQVEGALCDESVIVDDIVEYSMYCGVPAGLCGANGIWYCSKHNPNKMKMESESGTER